jgi:hypothetical protein
MTRWPDHPSSQSPRIVEKLHTFDPFPGRNRPCEAHKAHIPRRLLKPVLTLPVCLHCLICGCQHEEMSKKMGVRRCANPDCQREFEPNRPWHIYHSQACRYEAANAQRRLRKQNAPPGALPIGPPMRVNACNTHYTHLPSQDSRPPCRGLLGASQDVSRPPAGKPKRRSKKVRRPEPPRPEPAPKELPSKPPRKETEQPEELPVWLL